MSSQCDYKRRRRQRIETLATALRPGETTMLEDKTWSKKQPLRRVTTISKDLDGIITTETLIERAAA